KLWESWSFYLCCMLMEVSGFVPGQLDATCHAFVGETVVLPCTTSPPGEPNKSMLYWQINTTKVVHFSKNGQDSPEYQDKNFKGRTSLFPDQMKYGNFSLKLSNVTLEDNATYSCIYKQTESHQKEESTIKLEVSGK
ncbi:BTNLA protein, partial [Copsychus sechellarum]|nr:BTNLA protein [Copsychus sechellarum]